MSGLWVFVCGAPGAGKDSVMAWAQTHLADQGTIVFSRRMVSRPAHAGSDHDEVSVQQFNDMVTLGGLAWHWQAHGFSYGISAQYANDVAKGRVVVVNGSREHANGISLKSSPASRVRIVQVAADPDQLAQRLQQRGRDAPHAMANRLARNAQFSDLTADCTILNHGELADAGLQLVRYLTSLIQAAALQNRKEV